MGLTKLSRIFFYFLHQSACAKKPCKNNSTCLSGFTDKSYQCLCSAGFKGRACEEGKIRLHVISFMEEMSVCPSVTKNSLYKLHGCSVGEVKQINH